MWLSRSNRAQVCCHLLTVWGTAGSQPAGLLGAAHPGALKGLPAQTLGSVSGGDSPRWSLARKMTPPRG